MRGKPSVLIIDDVIDARVLGLQRQLKTKKISVESLMPDDVTSAQLQKADLILVDNDLGEWQVRAGSPLARSPADGLALAAMLRRHLANVHGLSPTALAIYTGQIKELAHPLPSENRRHILAGLNNLEWVFAKNDQDVALQVISLADAVLMLPRVTQRSGSQINIDGWLGINPSSQLASRLRDEVTSCNPPVHELTEWSHGIALLRWMLQRILPYPCFLWDSRRVASRLRVSHKSLVRAVTTKTKLAKSLAPFKYSGALAPFLGQRWWRAGIEQWLWESISGNAVIASDIRKTVLPLARGILKPSAVDEPVTCVDENYELIEDPVDPGAAVRVRPDDWPGYAEQPWMKIETVNGNRRLKAIVMTDEDRGRL